MHDCTKLGLTQCVSNWLNVEPCWGRRPTGDGKIHWRVAVTRNTGFHQYFKRLPWPARGIRAGENGRGGHRQYQKVDICLHLESSKVYSKENPLWIERTFSMPIGELSMRPTRSRLARCWLLKSLVWQPFKNSYITWPLQSGLGVRRLEAQDEDWCQMFPWFFEVICYRSLCQGLC